MIIHGRTVYPLDLKDGLLIDRGEVVVSSSPISFLGGVDPHTGVITDGDAAGKNIFGKIFVFPEGRGSTVGSYVMYGLKRYGNAPKAIVNRRSEIIVTVGAIISDTYLFDGVETALFMDGDTLSIFGDGSMELHDVEIRDAVTVILRNQGRILILKRSDSVGSCKGRWAGVSGHVEYGDEDIMARALIEVEEETGIKAEIARRAPPIDVRDTCGNKHRVWRIHPFLVEVSNEQAEGIEIDWEHTEYRWIDPADLENYRTVPRFADVLSLLLL